MLFEAFELIRESRYLGTTNSFQLATSARQLYCVFASDVYQFFEELEIHRTIALEEQIGHEIVERIDLNLLAHAYLRNVRPGS